MRLLYSASNFRITILNLRLSAWSEDLRRSANFRLSVNFRSTFPSRTLVTTAFGNGVLGLRVGGVCGFKGRNLNSDWSRKMSAGVGEFDVLFCLWFLFIYGFVVDFLVLEGEWE